MARFSFSFTGRKKQNVPPPPTGPRMSKAHKILGSTPLNIDAPGSWDDVSSLTTSDDRSETTGASYSESELRGHEYEHRVAIARSEEDWGEESDIIPHPLKPDAISFGNPTESVRTDTTGALRKSQSSSTIRSWYDKSKLPLSISQQTSSSAIAKGLPRNFQPGLNPTGVEEGFRSKKKPAKLMFSRTARKGSDSTCKDSVAESGLDRMLRSPSIISSFSVMSTRSRESRRFRKKHTKEDPPSPIPEPPRPVTSGSNRIGRGNTRELPSLYSHYEQMSLRNVMRQKSTPSLTMTENGILTLQNVTEVPYDGHEEEVAVHQPQKPASQNPKLTIFPKADLQSSSPERSVTRCHTKTSKASKSVDRSLEGADLLQTSVLMLSSDSEEDDAEPRPPVVRPSAPAPLRKPSKLEARAPPLEECRPKMVSDPKPSEERASQSTKLGKRRSVSASNTYVARPSPENRLRAPTAMSSRSGTPLGSFSPAISSPRTSVMSYSSVNSGMTWQGKPGYGVQEARAMTVFPAWRPPGAELEEKQDEASNTTSRMSRQPILNQTSSTDQLTPPLSPTSVDFYIGSAHSSIDGPGSHSRLIAVSHQEEVLLSALRQKQQAMRRASMSQVSEESEVDSVAGINGQPENCRREQQGMESDMSSDDAQTLAKEGHRKEHQAKESQTTITGSTFEFGFPAPPSFKEDTNTHNEQSPRRLESSDVHPPIHTEGIVLRSDSIPTSPVGPPPTLALPKLPKHARNSKPLPSRDNDSTQSQRDVTLYFDDSEPSPDLSDIQGWESATAPTTNAVSPDAPLATSWPGHEGGQASGKQVLPSSKLESQLFLYCDGFSELNVRNQAPNQEKEATPSGDKDIPRPDSPISPEAFPAVPARRVTLSNMARLSAVGPGLFTTAGAPGRLGDDD